MGEQVPLGYDADGRTLKIKDDEAKTIRMIYDLYENHRTVREVKAAADDLELRSRQRTSADGQYSGGLTFSRGHIHNLLTNPIQAGRIRHKTKVHGGQHDAIIEPDRWDRIQHMLQEATRVREDSDGYAKAYVDFAQKQMDLMTRAARNVGKATQIVETESKELTSEANERVSDKVVAK